MLRADVDYVEIGSASFLCIEVRPPMEHYLLDVDKLRVDRWLEPIVKDFEEILQVANLTRLVDTKTLLDEPVVCWVGDNK